jgi:acetolactate decarboxylase
MRRRTAAAILGLACLACCSAPIAAPDRDGVGDAIVQTSIINALMLGRYDGVTPVADLLRLGDFGLGTVDRLDGELIILDGRAYQARGDGSVADAAGMTTPFAVVTPFDADGSLPCPPSRSLTDLEAALDAALPWKNSFVAIRIEVDLESVTIRSVPRQDPPYRPLEEVSKAQSVWTREGAKGTLLGIRSPAWVAGLTVPGHHWHFLSADHDFGGHVLDVRIRSGTIRYDICREWRILLPDDSPGFDAADLTPDLSRELKRVESARDPSPAE